MATIISIRNLSKSFGGVQALQDIDLDITQGKIHAIIGANGAGKSTLLRVLLGLEKHDRGDIIFNGKNIKNYSMAKRIKSGMGYSPQMPQLCESLNATENLALAVKNKEAINNILQTLPFYESRYLAVKNLNHGHRKILQIAMALALQPKLLILDEPTQALDSSNIALCKKMIKKYEGTIILVEHNIDIVMQLADKITRLHLGKILQTE